MNDIYGQSKFMPNMFFFICKKTCKYCITSQVLLHFIRKNVFLSLKVNFELVHKGVVPFLLKNTKKVFLRLMV